MGEGNTALDERKTIVKPVTRKKQEEKRIYKVAHLTKTKCSIGSHIDSELLLLNIFSSTETVKMKNILIDTYETGRQRIVDLFPEFCDAARRCLEVENAGSYSSIYSESVSINYFSERFHATDFLLEMEVMYEFVNWKIVDFVCTMYGQRVGVSTTRAMLHSTLESFTVEKAKTLLHKKLAGLINARRNVSEKHSFTTCFLHIFCMNEEIANVINEVYPSVLQEDESGLFSEAIVLATICRDKTDRFIFQNHVKVPRVKVIK